MSAASRWGTPVSLIRLEGRDTRRFLHGQSSQAIELAQPGTCLPTCLISPTARMRGLALVAVDDTGADLIVIAGDGETIRSGLDRVLFPADNVRLGAVEPATLWQWQGGVETGNSQLLRPGVDLGSGPAAAALLQRSGPGLPCWLEALTQWSFEEVEVNRIRRIIPAYPGEISDETNPLELGLGPWASLSKGCYIGQEALAKLANNQGPKQHLRYWSSPMTLATKTRLLDINGNFAGIVTSSIGNEGLALIRRDHANAQTLMSSGHNVHIKHENILK